MAIAFDAASSQMGGSVNSLSWSHTCAGSNRLLLVGVSCAHPDALVASVTYAGVSLTKIERVVFGGYATVDMWYLVAPPLGAGTIVVTLSPGQYVDIAAGAGSWTDVNQSTPKGTHASALGSDAVATVDVSSATNEVVLDVVYASKALTVVAGQIQRWNIGDVPLVDAGSSEPGAASVTMSWSLSVSGRWAIIAVPIKPAPSAVSAYFSMRFEGLQPVTSPASVRYESIGLPVSQSFHVPVESVEASAAASVKPALGSGVEERVPAGTPDGRGNS